MENKNLTYDIVGAAIAIHKRLGRWHAEHVYKWALRAALIRQGLDVLADPSIVLKDVDGTALAVYRPDLVVRSESNGRYAVLVELEAVDALTDAHLKQVKAYLTAWQGQASGLLLNFGAPRLEWKKVWRERHESNHNHKPKRRRW